MKSLRKWFIRRFVEPMKLQEEWLDECEEQIKELQKENNRLAQHIVELQKDKGNLIDENNHYKALVSVLEDNAEQLRNDLKQAKEIIKKLCGAVRALNNPNTELTDIDGFLSEAEQFLKENDIEQTNEKKQNQKDQQVLNYMKTLVEGEFSITKE